MKNEPHELEIVPHSQLNNVNMIFNRISYRAPHMHNDFELICNFEGDIIYTVGSDSILVPQGSFLIINPQQVHEITSASPNPFTVCLQVSPAFFASVRSDIQQLVFDANYINVHTDCAIPKLLLHLSRSYLSQENNYEFYCSSLIFMIFSELLSIFPHHIMSTSEKKTSCERAERISSIINYADRHYTEKISLSDLAVEQNLSLTYLSRFIRANLHRSFQEYIGELRFQHARQLVLHTKTALIDICEECGYSNYRYFHQEFMKYCGCTPSQYRNTNTDTYSALSSRNSTEERLSRTEAVEKIALLVQQL